MKCWPTVKLSEVALLNPTRPRELRGLSDNYEVAFVPMPAVNQYTGLIDGIQVRQFGEVKKGFTYFADGDVIFAKITPCMQNGKAAIARGLSNGLGFGSTEFHVIRPNTERIIPEWIWHFVRQQSFRNEGTRHFRGAVGQQRVPADYLANTSIPLPTVAEQHRIARRIQECLERLEEIESLRKQVNRETDGIELACFHDALLEGIGKKGWPMRILGDVAKSFRYGTSAKADSAPVGVPVLRMGNIQGGYLSCSELKYINVSSSELERYRLTPGDILINRTNSLELVGKAATFDRRDGDWIYASYLVRVEVDDSLAVPEFVTAVINSRMGRRYVMQTARRAIGMVNLNAKEMARFPLPQPTIEEQKKVVIQLEAARYLALELRATMSEPELAFAKEAMLRKAFAGEL